MVYIFSILGYGDCLITLSLLEQQPDVVKTNWIVVGTKVTADVAKLMRHPLSVLSVLSDTASFYTIKEKGLLRAAVDVLAIRRWSKQMLKHDDVLVFEKEDWRNAWLVPKKINSIRQVPRQENAYIDRARALQEFCPPLTLPPCKTLSNRPSQLLLNPSARHHSRTLKGPVIDAIIDAARNVRAEVCLIDIDGKFKEWRNQVALYRNSPELKESIALLEKTDCYIGPDSFFLHLAYYHKIPFFGFFYRQNMYFAPPGMINAGNYIYFDEAQDLSKLKAKLSAFLGCSMS